MTGIRARPAWLISFRGLPVNFGRRFSMLSDPRNGSLVPTFAGPVNRLSSLFDRFFQDDFFTPWTSAPAWTSLPLSLWEDEHNIYVEMDMPGVTENDIDLCVHENVLIIRGERKCERSEVGIDTRNYGRFEQRVRLPAAVDVNEVAAKLANGVLRVTLPKPPEAKPRKISIKAE
jgi:HSP20 family protein